MEVSKQASGSIVKSFTFKAVISCKDESDRDIYNQCIEWRQQEELRGRKANTESSPHDEGLFAWIAARQASGEHEDDLRSQSVANGFAAVSGFDGSEEKKNAKLLHSPMFSLNGIAGFSSRSEDSNEDGAAANNPKDW